MSNIVMDQHVKRRIKVKPPVHPVGFRGTAKRGFGDKRRFGGSSPSTLNHLPGASPRTDIIQGIKQRPARLSRTHVKQTIKKQEKIKQGKLEVSRPPLVARAPLAFLFGRQGLFPLSRPRIVPKAPADFPAINPVAKKIRVPLPSFPLSPIIAAVLTLIISVVAINWKAPIITSLMDENRSYLDLAGRGEDLERNLAFYAGIHPQAAPAEDGEAIPLDLMETFTWKEYRVQKGDTLSEIAQAQKRSMGTLIASNSITNARRLREGEILRIPNMDGIPYTVKAGDSLSGISGSSSVPLRVILDVNNLESDVITPGMSLFLPGATMPQEELRLALGESFIYPVRGVLSSPYGWRVDPIAKVDRFHSAIDLAAPLGTPVGATMDGKVSRVATNSVYGKYIILTHQSGYQSLYAHLSVVSVKQDAWVSRGSKIGEVGSTGYSTGPHLHFSVFKDNRAINPLEVLQR
jgi:murein DD-endopeptidase MepM/ murein hydrolase activator NlpD